MHAVTTATVMLAMSIVAAPALAEVVVTYKNPDRFTDASADQPSRVASPRVLDAFQAQLGELGVRYLRPSQRLQIEISDIDLAGEFESTPLDQTRRLRVLRDVTWPSIKLRYVLSEAGRVLAQGDEQLKELNYMRDLSNGSPGDPLRYEKNLLDRWFKARFESAPAMQPPAQ